MYQSKISILYLQDVALSDPKNERALGDLLVLVQYQWPKEEAVFANLITTIQKRRKFSFPEFFKYIISILLYIQHTHYCNSKEGATKLKLVPFCYS